MKLLLALMLILVPPSKKDAVIKEVHGKINLPHNLYLGASHAIAYQRLARKHVCYYAPVRPRQFWIIECSAGKIRALGQYGSGLLQYEEYGTNQDSFIGAVCGGDKQCYERSRFVLLVPGWHKCEAGASSHPRDAVAEYDAARERLLYQEWMQWDIGIDFLDAYRKDDSWSGK